MWSMRQLIARIDERLHDELKGRAAAEGRSLNSLVIEILSAAVSGDDERSRVRARLATAGIRVAPKPPSRVPSRDRAIAATRGAGRVASEALAAERAAR